MPSKLHQSLNPDAPVKPSSEQSADPAAPLAKADQPSQPDLSTQTIDHFKTMVDAVTEVGTTIGNQVIQTGKAAIKTSIDVGDAIGQTVSAAGESVVQFATDIGNATFRHTHRFAEHATTGTGQAVTYVSDNPLIRKLTKALKLDWLVGMSDQVDVTKAADAVHQLQQAHPDESPSQIAHRIMVEKAVYAGGVGLASSLVPGEAIALLAVDLATTSKLQTEMLYQIAAAYGLDLTDPARKGEVIAIFGLALGGSRAVRAGLVFVKNVPFAGAVIGASANATILYALGYAACRFYEAKLNPDVPETATTTLESIKQTSETYLEVAIAQQAIMDQILAHMILASYPQTSWDDILPRLQSLALPPTSLNAIAANLKAPQPLSALLDQLNRDFAVLALARCHAIAQLNGHILPEAAAVIDAIREKFDLDVNALKAPAQSSQS